MRVIQKKTYIGLVIASTLLSSCGGVNVWPFNGSDKQAVDIAKPANSTEYICDLNKKFYIRNLDKGESVWLILPDREVGLTKQSATRYSNGITTFTIDNGDATLEVNPATIYKTCKTNSALK